MADARESNPLVDQIRRGGVPLEVRMMAAEGALPLKPEDVVDLLEVMRHDSEPEVASLAARTFSELSIETLLPVVKARDTSTGVLAWTLEIRTELSALSGARVAFAYEVHRAGTTGPLATASTSHAAVDLQGRPRRLPEELRRRLA